MSLKIKQNSSSKYPVVIICVQNSCKLLWLSMPNQQSVVCQAQLPAYGQAAAYHWPTKHCLAALVNTQTHTHRHTESF